MKNIEKIKSKKIVSNHNDIVELANILSACSFKEMQNISQLLEDCPKPTDKNLPLYLTMIEKFFLLNEAVIESGFFEEHKNEQVINNYMVLLVKYSNKINPS